MSSNEQQQHHGGENNENEVRVLVPVADGTEDIELSSITDTLVRAGASVTVSSVMDHKQVRLARNLHVVADSLISDEDHTRYHAVLLPGGMPGAQHLADSKKLREMLLAMRTGGRIYGAICASPAVVFGPHGLLDGVPTATCYPGFKDKLPRTTQWSPAKVVVHGRCLTSQGPGTAVLFALTAVSMLYSTAKAHKIADALLVDFQDNMIERV